MFFQCRSFKLPPYFSSTMDQAAVKAEGEGAAGTKVAPDAGILGPNPSRTALAANFVWWPKAEKTSSDEKADAKKNKEEETKTPVSPAAIWGCWRTFLAFCA